MRSSRDLGARRRDRRGSISAYAEQSVVLYWDLVWLGGTERLIRVLRGVVQWRCFRYLEYMLSLCVMRASQLRIWEVLAALFPEDLGSRRHPSCYVA